MEKMGLMVVITNFVNLSKKEREKKLVETRRVMDTIWKKKEEVRNNPMDFTYSQVDQLASDDYDIQIEFRLFTSISEALGDTYVPF